MLKTNTNKYKQNIKKYIVDCIPEEWGESESEKLNTLKEEFKRVADHPYNLKRYPNNQERLADYLSGLPINIDFTNYDILQRDKQLREYTQDLPEKKQDKIISNYFNFMAYQIMRIWGEY